MLLTTTMLLSGNILLWCSATNKLNRIVAGEVDAVVEDVLLVLLLS